MKVNKHVVIPVVASVASFGVGVATGYFIHKKRNVAPMEHIVISTSDEPVDQIALDFDKAAEDRDAAVANHPSSKAVVVEETTTVQTLTLVETEPETELVNIFTNEETEWSYEEELAKRAENPDAPYIIHRDEFYEAAAKEDYDESTLMYYAGDDILCDSHDTPIYDYRRTTTGELRFGHGSHDPSIVYIRNEEQKAQYEVILDRGYFQVEVLGAQIEEDLSAPDLQHSLRKMRD